MPGQLIVSGQPHLNISWVLKNQQLCSSKQSLLVFLLLINDQSVAHAENGESMWYHLLLYFQHPILHQVLFILFPKTFSKTSISARTCYHPKLSQHLTCSHYISLLMILLTSTFALPSPSNHSPISSQNDLFETQFWLRHSTLYTSQWLSDALKREFSV